MYYDKLVRNKIPEVILASGSSCRTARVQGHDVVRYLKDKMVEELNEFLSEPSAEELGDILEVVEALASHFKIDMIQAKACQLHKGIDRGSFSDGVILKEVYDD